MISIIDPPQDADAWLLEELCQEYPSHTKFFNLNNQEIISSLWDVKSEKELSIIRERFETNASPHNIPSSSSIFTAEDVLVELLDFKRELSKLIPISNGDTLSNKK